jgi:hypothetical protein
LWGCEESPALVVGKRKPYHRHNGYGKTEGKVYNKKVFYALSVIVKYIPVEKIAPVKGKDIGYHQC